jgi:hypothetical protein
MSKEASIKHNSLIINVLPPPIGGGKDTEDTPVNSYIIKLVSRLLDMADEGYDILTPIDRETLRDVLALGSIEKVAKKQHKSDSYIRTKVNKAIDALTNQMKLWQDSHQKLMEQSKRIQELEKALEIQTNNEEHTENLSNIVETMAQRYCSIAKENRNLKEEIINLRAVLTPVELPNSSSMVKADEKAQRMLKLHLEDINIPSDIANKLKDNNITTIYDLVRYDENQLLRFRDIGYSDLKKITKRLIKTGLSLGTDVRWVEAAQEYYIKKDPE